MCLQLPFHPMTCCQFSFILSSKQKYRHGKFIFRGVLLLETKLASISFYFRQQILQCLEWLIMVRHLCLSLQPLQYTSFGVSCTLLRHGVVIVSLGPVTTIIGTLTPRSTQPCIPLGSLNRVPFLVWDIIYTSLTYVAMSVSVCLWRKCIGAL